MELKAIHRIGKNVKNRASESEHRMCMWMIEIRMNLEIFALTRVLSDFFLKWAGM